jgi:hypothetical protein
VRAGEPHKRILKLSDKFRVSFVYYNTVPAYADSLVRAAGHGQLVHVASLWGVIGVQGPGVRGMDKGGRRHLGPPCSACTLACPCHNAFAHAFATISQRRSRAAPSRSRGLLSPFATLSLLP